MKTNYYYQLLTAVLLGVLFVQCKKDDTEPSVDKVGKELNEFIVGLPEVSQEEEADYLVSSEGEVTTDYYGCKTKTYTGHPGFNELIFSRTSSDVLYPGVLLNGQSVIDGTYTMCNLERAPMTLTVNLQNLGGDISKTIEKPSYSTVQTAIHEVLSQEMTGSQGAELNYTISKVYSKAHMMAELGVNCDLADVFSMSKDFSFNAGADFQRVIVKFCQNYYDIIVDQPTDPSNFLNIENQSVEQIKAKLGTESPMYISSVTYGRLAMLCFESVDMSFDLKSSVEASMPIPIDGGVALNAGAKQTFEAMVASGAVTCKAYVLGGSGADACKSITGGDGFENFITNGGDYSKDSPGKPISYTLRHLSNNKPVKVIMATDYEETVCSKLNNRFRVNLKRLSLGKLRAISLPQVYIPGAIDLYKGVGSKKELVGSLYSKGELITVKNGLATGLGYDVEFKALKDEDFENAYIEFHINIKSNAIEAFSPNVIRVYLKDIVEGDNSVVTNTYWHSLTLNYTYEALKK